MSAPDANRSGPTVDPSTVYPPVEGLPDTYNTFNITDNAQTTHDALKAAHKFLSEHKANFMGFQCNQALHYSHNLAPYLDMSPNNIGDPFQTGSFILNTKFMERAVLDYFASLWNARWPSISRSGESADPESNSYWGYVLSMGSTEGNLDAVWTARDYLSGKKLLFEPSAVSARAGGAPPKIFYSQALPPSDNANAYTPVAFYSADTHYSVVKAMTMMSVQTFAQVGNAS